MQNVNKSRIPGCESVERSKRAHQEIVPLKKKKKKGVLNFLTASHLKKFQIRVSLCEASPVLKHLGPEEISCWSLWRRTLSHWSDGGLQLFNSSGSSLLDLLFSDVLDVLMMI